MDNPGFQYCWAHKVNREKEYIMSSHHPIEPKHATQAITISDDVATEIVHAVRDILIELIHLIGQRNRDSID